MMSKSYGEHRSQTAVPAVTLRERPDQVLFHLTAAVETESAAAALGILKRAALRLEEQLVPLGATLAVTDFHLPSDAGKPEASPSNLHATLTLPFGRDAGTWERVAKVAQVEDLLRALVLEGKKQKPKCEVLRSLPVFVVADPEAHRATLVQRLHERARSLGGGQPVQLKKLRFDQAVEQRSVGIDQVELFLRVEGCAEVLLLAEG